MKKGHFLSLLFLAATTLSCKKDNLENVQQSSENKERNERLVEGRFHFASRESLEKTIQEMRNNEKLLGKTIKKRCLEEQAKVS
ncbi:MAG: hypothetical protein Q4A09_01540 [Capnocytophaga felis]|nr:hypothetical protein [Capnocytophaga felis]